MRKHSLFRITAAVLLTAATASWEKEEVIIKNGSGTTTTTKAVKGTTYAKLWSETRYAPIESPRDITEYSISNPNSTMEKSCHSR